MELEQLLPVWQQHQVWETWWRQAAPWEYPAQNHRGWRVKVRVPLLHAQDSLWLRGQACVRPKSPEAEPDSLWAFAR